MPITVRTFVLPCGAMLAIRGPGPRPPGPLPWPGRRHDRGRRRLRARRRAPARGPPRAAPRTPALPAMVLIPASASKRDLEVGDACRRGLGDTSGAVVAMDPYTGRVMALVNPSGAHGHGLSAVLRVQDRRGHRRPHRRRHHARRRPTTARADAGSGRGTAPWTCAAPSRSPATPISSASAKSSATRRSITTRSCSGSATSPASTSTERPRGRIPASVRPSQVGHLSSHAAGIATSAVQLGVLLSATLNGGIVFQPQVSGPDGFEPRERWRLPAGNGAGRAVRRIRERGERRQRVQRVRPRRDRGRARPGPAPEWAGSRRTLPPTGRRS